MTHFHENTPIVCLVINPNYNGWFKETHKKNSYQGIPA